MISIAIYTSPLGNLLLGEYNSRLCLCDWVDSTRHQANLHRIRHLLNDSFQHHQSPTLNHTIELLDAILMVRFTHSTSPSCPLAANFKSMYGTLCQASTTQRLHHTKKSQRKQITPKPSEPQPTPSAQMPYQSLSHAIVSSGVMELSPDMPEDLPQNNSS